MEIYWSLLIVLLWTCRSIDSVSGELRDKRMSNGSIVSNEQFPYVAKVVINGVNCSGFILHKRFVATGRQCINDVRKSKTSPYIAQIYAGFKSLKKSSDYYHDGVQKVRIISAYCYSEDNKENQLPDDLCLLKVFPRFMWTRTVNVAKLPQKSKWPVSENKLCVLASYGKSLEDDDVGTLRAATLNVKHPLTCASLNKSQHLDRLLCSNSEVEVVPCAGDNGAPLACGSYVVAILQANDKKDCGEPVDDVAFTYLPPYLPFIETVLWSQPERYRVWIRSSAVSYLSNSNQDFRFHIIFFIINILGKHF